MPPRRGEMAGHISGPRRGAPAGRVATIGAMQSSSPQGERVTLRVELTPRAKARLEQLADDHGATQLMLMSRLAEWFAHQGEALQSIAMGHLPAEVHGDVARMILRPKRKA